MPNKKAPHGAFLLHRYKQSLDAMIAFQTKPEALLRFENARVFATFHTGIPTPVSMGDAIALGKQIKAVRKAMKMTQEQLALKSNVSVKYIANIENGKQNPSFDILSSILHVLPLSLDSVINPNLSEAERECRELESIYFACPPEMQKTLLDATRSLAIHLTELSEQNKNT